MLNQLLNNVKAPIVPMFQCFSVSGYEAVNSGDTNYSFETRYDKPFYNGTSSPSDRFYFLPGYIV
jgi:hypothetical protein